MMPQRFGTPCALPYNTKALSTLARHLHKGHGQSWDERGCEQMAHEMTLDEFEARYGLDKLSVALGRYDQLEGSRHKYYDRRKDERKAFKSLKAKAESDPDLAAKLKAAGL